MTDYSLNKQFQDLVQKTFQEQDKDQLKNSSDQEMKQNNINDNNSVTVKSLDFFQGNNVIKKKKRKANLKPYTTSRIKTTNYLSNISYNGVTKENFCNKNFVFDIYILLTKNLNPFSLDRKLSDQNKDEMIYEPWKTCIPVYFYKFIRREEDFLYLNGKNILYPKIAEIFWKFINENENNCNQLRDNLCQFNEIFHYVYSIVYPEIYCTAERSGFDLKSTFQLVFKTYKDKKRWSISVKNQAILQKREMKHLSLNKNLWKLTVLIKRKKKNLTKKLKKEKKSRREIAEKNKLLKRKKKLDEEKVEEKELWGKLNELNKEFQTIITLKKTKKNV